ncbi:MAG: hypothetical protein GF317_01750 [Candidatus Lokiarchaeota archaeon]|nr:hypothetical protein [Candidatus Lokiarchaeota archaeon]MBD3198665.1 hypothetical protein [Candidatus Lokiarchaeota archaeon]
MRKRTQLVGFEFGYWKHSQYSAEFLDNALDAIETFQWSELNKEESPIKFTLDQEIFLENFSILQSDQSEDSSSTLNEEARQTLLEEIKTSPKSEKIPEKKESPLKEGEKRPKKKEEIEEIEVKNTIKDMESLIQPVNNINIIDKEPLVIIRITESEAHSLLTGEIDVKNVMSYKFEVFDNGLGMAKSDLGKYGKYLASSKSMELKQTRGSQGFGAPSAFSDAQNTTGKPIVVVSKTADNIYAGVSEFFTTSKNEKRYVIEPTEIDVPFLHGTYVKLHYLNTKYVRGYVDTYVKETALMNPHVTIIYIDPYNEEFIFPRKVSSFPAEPKYAKPHPSSTNIGDLQDLLGKSNNLTLTAFLQDNFVRMSYNTAKEVVELAEKDLQDNMNYLILKSGYINKPKKKNKSIYYSRYEKRVYGRSDKPRDKLIVYELVSDELKDKYWSHVTEYNNYNKDIDDITKKIKKIKDKIQNADTKKEKRKLKKDIRKLRDQIENIRGKKDTIKKNIDKIIKDNEDGLNEIKSKNTVGKMKDLVLEVKISEARPSDLTNDQFNSLFFAFKSIKYMSPPTDTVVPVGDVILENTLIKELGLRVSENLDDFGAPQESYIQSRKIFKNGIKNQLLQENPNLKPEELEDVKIDNEKINLFNSKILSTFLIEEPYFEPENYEDKLEDILKTSEESQKNDYKQVFEYFVENFTRDDDFIAAETRDPTSGKGLAYVVEGVLAYSNKLEVPKRSRDVLSRFVNRTPKLRDTADCAITKAAQSVNWKNYNLDTYDNGLPKGPIKLLINVSGPYVHLMFKSQSKNSLADDENLINEIKYCLEAIGRRLRVYLNRRDKIRKKEKRANLIEKYIPKFVSSVYNIAQDGSKYKDQISKKELELLMSNAVRTKRPQVIDKLTLEKPKEEKLKIVEEQIQEIEEAEEKESEKKTERELLKKKEIELEKKSDEQIAKEIKPDSEEETIELDLENIKSHTIKELRSFAESEDIDLPSKAKKAKLVDIIEDSMDIEEKKQPDEEEAKKEIDMDDLNKLTIKELRKIGDQNNISIPSRIRKAEIIEIIESELGLKKKKEKKAEKIKKKPPIKREKEKKVPKKAEEKKPKAKTKPPPMPSKTKQQKLPIITTDRILRVLDKNDWQTIKHLIFKMRIKDMLDARLLQVKLKELERKDQVAVKTVKGKKHWKLK